VLFDTGGDTGVISPSLGSGETPLRSVPVGTQITVYADDGSTVLYTYTTTETNSPAVATTSIPMLNTGFEPFSQGPVYISNTPSGMGKLDGKIVFDMP
jgi:PE-PGRS C-terminal aspartyl peptidase-like domain